MFTPGTLDDEFYRLDGEIDAFATSLEGYVGVDRWYSENRTVRNSVYYFTDMATVKSFPRSHNTSKLKKNMRNGTTATRL